MTWTYYLKNSDNDLHYESTNKNIVLKVKIKTKTWDCYSFRIIFMHITSIDTYLSLKNSEKKTEFQ